MNGTTPTDDRAEQHAPSGQSDTIEVSVYYTRGGHHKDADWLDEGTEAYELSRDLRCFGPETFDRVEHSFEDVLDVAYATLCDGAEMAVDEVAGDPENVEHLAIHVYRRLQGPRTDEVLGYDGTEFRSATTGDLFVIDGTVVMVDSLGYAVLGDFEALVDGEEVSA